ncbi:hypothetical protein SBC2_10230 [Caballeronia sp. SBC2]|nr:hypothetical protein SBC2_10230 [Caballeronia sp. SBC2]
MNKGFALLGCFARWDGGGGTLLGRTQGVLTVRQKCAKLPSPVRSKSFKNQSVMR